MMQHMAATVCGNRRDMRWAHSSGDRRRAMTRLTRPHLATLQMRGCMSSAGATDAAIMLNWTHHADCTSWPAISGSGTWRAHALHLLRGARCCNTPVLAESWGWPDHPLRIAPISERPRMDRTIKDRTPWTGLPPWDRNMAMTHQRPREVHMNASDAARVQNYLRQRFGNKRLSIARRENKEDPADLMLEDEFIGVVFADDEDGELCYHVQISILDEDLEDNDLWRQPCQTHIQAQIQLQIVALIHSPARAIPNASANMTSAITPSSIRQACGFCICGARSVAP